MRGVEGVTWEWGTSEGGYITERKKAAESFYTADITHIWARTGSPSIPTLRGSPITSKDDKVFRHGNSLGPLCAQIQNDLANTRKNGNK